MAAQKYTLTIRQDETTIQHKHVWEGDGLRTILNWAKKNGIDISKPSILEFEPR